MTPRDRPSGRRPRPGILVKLLVAFGAPTVLLFAVFAVVAHEVARENLDDELGTRLEAVAASAATQVRGKYLVDLDPGEREHRAYLNTRRKLRAVAEATGLERIYVFDRRFRSRADSREDVPIGTTYFQAELDRHELEGVFDRGDAVSSVLFEGDEGRLYKAGYAPVRASESDSRIVLALGVEAPAAYFSQLADLRARLVAYGAGLVAVVLAISVAVAMRLTRPVRRLQAAAARIGKGDLDAPVHARSRDELGFLAETMERMRRDLRDRDVRMQMMLSGIAHEIRNPLGGIELFAGILKNETPESDERRAHIDRIDRELRYLEAVVTEFLDYARRPQPEIAPIDAGALVAEVADIARAEAEAAAVSIEVEAHPAPCAADAGQLRRAVLNLARNAVQAAAGHEPARVTLTARASQGGVVIRVANTGPPIPDDVRARIFEPFFTTREKGTGLGLALSREIVRDHGGTLDVTSDEVAGTELALRLFAGPPGRAPGHESPEAS